jgi:plastocyanin
MRRFRLFPRLLPLPLAAIATVSLVHCSSSDPSPSGDAGAAPGDASNGLDAAAGSEAGASLNGCGAADFAANDHTAAGDARAITFPGDGEAARQFTPACMRIAAGEAVTWTGGFSTHPLETAGGDSPSPITVTSGGTTRSFTFASAGRYGFDCLNHPGIMRGAIEVLP